MSYNAMLPYKPLCFAHLKLLQVYPEGKMSQHFGSLKPGDVVEVKGYVIYIYKYC
jgi:NAD(P)H-flavin reductase